MGVRDFLAARPGVDLVVPVGVGVAWAVWGDALIPTAEGTRVQLYLGGSTLAGLVVAAATFVCAMLYQSASPYVEVARRRYSRELRRNWRSILGSTLLAALLPLAAMVVDERSTLAAMTMLTFSLALVVVRFARCLYWLGFTLFMQHASESQPPDRVVPLSARQAS